MNREEHNLLREEYALRLMEFLEKRPLDTVEVGGVFYPINLPAEDFVYDSEARSIFKETEKGGLFNRVY